jgi:hypothetical protein
MPHVAKPVAKAMAGKSAAKAQRNSSTGHQAVDAMAEDLRLSFGGRLYACKKEEELSMFPA